MKIIPQESVVSYNKDIYNIYKETLRNRMSQKIGPNGRISSFIIELYTYI
ncbi:hypothetical protein HMPREF3201_02381 [Megasphaera sp. MJR8396C]|nr:hypothetical protein HMPREF3201_02381 [Megasphaera sp. MJR8396C]